MFALFNRHHKCWCGYVYHACVLRLVMSCCFFFSKNDGHYFHRLRITASKCESIQLKDLIWINADSLHLKNCIRLEV